jgi:hypothetical protein
MRLVMNAGVVAPHNVVNGRTIRPGEEFEVNENDGRLWKLLGRARDAPPQAKSMNAEPVPREPEPPVKRGPGRPRKYPIQESPTYNRRDMRAEDE